MGAQHLTFLLLAAGCAGGPDQPDTVLGAPPPRLVAESAAPAPSPEPAKVEDEVAWQERLRREVATGPDPVPAAMELAQWLIHAERHADALAVVMAALERKPGDPRLMGGRAILLRDLGRRSDALAVLTELCGGRPAKELHPSVLCERAELEWQAGRNAVARDLLSSLEQAHAGDPWLVENAQMLAALTTAVAKPAPPRPSARDLLGDLRGASDPQRRMAVYKFLREAGPAVRHQATCVAAHDPHPALRAAAIHDSVVEPGALGAVCLAGLRDPDAFVRRAAARRTKDLPAAAAAAILVAALAVENDPEAFAALHEELAERQPGGPALPFGAAADAEVRRAVAAAWQKQWAQ